MSLNRKPPSKMVAGVERIVRSTEKPDSIRRAVVRAVPPHGSVALIQIAGSKTLARADIPHGETWETLQPGTKVLVAKPREGRNWIILMPYVDSDGAAPNVPQGRDALASPDNVQGLEGRGFNALLWNTPPGYNLLYEIEIATDPGTYLSTSTVYVVGGAYVDVVAPGTQRAYRVRAVSPDWKKSGWTTWETLTSAGVRTGTEANLPALVYGDYYATDTNTLYIGDGSAWHAIGGLASQEWNPDLEPESPGSIDDEFEDASFTGWTEYDYHSNQSVVESGGVLALGQPSQATATFTGVYKTLPSGDFTVVTKVKLTHDLTDSVNDVLAAGIALYMDGATESALVLLGGIGSVGYASGYESTRTGQGYAWINSGITTGSFSGDFDTDTYYYVRFRKNSSGIFLDKSIDGISWSTVVTFAVGAYSHVGLGIINYGSPASATATFEFFRYRNSFDAVTDPCYGAPTASNVVTLGVTSINNTDSPYTLASTGVLLCDTDSGNITVNLPLASSYPGRMYRIKNTGTGTVTVDGSGSDTIDGSLTATLSQNEAITIISDGTEWWII